MFKAIIFDIGGVVYKGTYEEFIENLALISKVSKDVLNNALEPHIDVLLLGKKSFFDITNQLKISNNNVIEAAEKTYTLDRDIENLINSLSGTYKVACLSNAMDIDIALDEKTNLKNLFDVYVNSCLVGIRKPDREIYSLVLEKLKCEAKECLFIDDKKKYTKVAKALGMKSIVFEDFVQLKSELSKLHILDL